jgi:hypothetical protein
MIVNIKTENAGLVTYQSALNIDAAGEFRQGEYLKIVTLAALQSL